MPISSALASRFGVIGLVMTRAWVAVIAPDANASAVAGSRASRRAVDTIALASAGANRQLPRSQAFMLTAPSVVWSCAASATRTARCRMASSRFTPVVTSAMNSSRSSAESACRSTAASASNADCSSDTTPPRPNVRSTGS
jgi:hypothetical protein